MPNGNTTHCLQVVHNNYFTKIGWYYMKIDVRFLPARLQAPELANTVCIVLDIFRATTSIITAMNNGCNTIIPVESIEEAKRAAAGTTAPLLAGERQSIKIAGFDFGNSPREFAAGKVQGRTVIMTTTNGTIAIKSTAGAYRTLIGAFINARAVCRQAKAYQKDILLICAGTDRLFSLEDALCAGLLVDCLQGPVGVELTDAALGAWSMYQGVKASLVEVAGTGRNGRRLYDLGLEEDVRYCLQSDRMDIVPEYCDGRIILSAS